MKRGKVSFIFKHWLEQIVCLSRNVRRIARPIHKIRITGIIKGGFTSDHIIKEIRRGSNWK